MNRSTKQRALRLAGEVRTLVGVSTPRSGIPKLLSDPALIADCKAFLAKYSAERIARIQESIARDETFADEVKETVSKAARAPKRWFGTDSPKELESWARATGFDPGVLSITICKLNGVSIGDATSPQPSADAITSERKMHEVCRKVLLNNADRWEWTRDLSEAQRIKLADIVAGVLWRADLKQVRLLKRLHLDPPKPSTAEQVEQYMPAQSRNYVGLVLDVE